MAISITNDALQNATPSDKERCFRRLVRPLPKKIGDVHKRRRPGSAEDNCVDALNNVAAIHYAKYHLGVDPVTATDSM